MDGRKVKMKVKRFTPLDFVRSPVLLKAVWWHFAMARRGLFEHWAILIGDFENRLERVDVSWEFGDLVIRYE
ncbi:hypothetical protein KKF82_05115 [Patescibacteria group bacterium]|nr:hypothetical protein [Patescibacteria group bacterium]